MAMKKKAGTAMAKWEEKLLERANVAAKMEENSLGLGNSISTQGGVMRYRDADVPGNKINAVILDHTFLNAFYTEAFDPDNPSNPDCFALSKEEKELAPHEKSTDAQNKDCATCPHNEWGSADTGRGKACNNNRRLILITEEALSAGVGDAQCATIKVPTTSLSAWAQYVTNLKELHKRPPLGVVTEISLVPDKKHQWHMNFKLVRTIDDGDVIEAAMEKSDSKMTQDMLMAPFLPMPEADKPARRGSKAKAGAKARR